MDYLPVVWGWIVENAVAASTVVTALATTALGWFTYVLARETRHLSRASAQAHVVATIEPNQWASNHLDLVVSNTGNATAHSVSIAFEPAPETNRSLTDGILPLQKISILKPGHSLSAYLSDFAQLANKTYRVTVKWKHRPSEKSLHELSYDINMGDYTGVGRLGASSPLHQVADQMKKLREDWQHIPKGRSRIAIDAFSGADRQREDEERQAWFEEMKREKPGTPEKE